MSSDRATRQAETKTKNKTAHPCVVHDILEALHAVSEVARVDANFLESVGHSQRHGWREVNVRHQRDIAAAIPELLPNLHASISFESALHGQSDEVGSLCGNSKNLVCRFQSEALMYAKKRFNLGHRSIYIFSVRCGHCLFRYRMS